MNEGHYQPRGNGYDGRGAEGRDRREQVSLSPPHIINHAVFAVFLHFEFGFRWGTDFGLLRMLFGRVLCQYLVRSNE
ncbi:hypothetical protein V866_000834 [Kwoniella sp. B9012]